MTRNRGTGRMSGCMRDQATWLGLAAVVATTMTLAVTAARAAAQAPLSAPTRVETQAPERQPGSTSEGEPASERPAGSGHARSLHPTFPLLDRDGTHVLDSHGPVSTMVTCGGCHDTAFIAESSFHASVGLEALDEPGTVPGGRDWDTGPSFFGRWDPTTYRYLTPSGDTLLDLGTAEWVRRFGARHAGGGPALWSRDGQLLTDLPVVPGDPETHVMDPASGSWEPWDWQASGVSEFNCFLCHIDAPDNEARIEALDRGAFAWASTATLLGSGAVARDGDGWRWQPKAFDEDGDLSESVVTIRDPGDENCGQCHGLVHSDDETPILTTGCKPGYWSTERTGQIVSSQRMSESGMNLAGKETLTRSWDVHAERLVDCVDCHHSTNNPIYHRPSEDTQLEHLTFDARRMDVGDYLYRPSHELARGGSHAATDPSDPTGAEDLRCTSCHAPEPSHDWLPYTRRHFDALSCESCHVPELHAPTRRQYDWTVVRPDGQARTECRGVEGKSGAGRSGEVETLITGYEPVLLPRRNADGSSSLAPHNLISAWYWVAGDPERPVRARDLQHAYLEGGAYHPDVLAALDTNGDGEISEAELSLDTPAEVDLIAGRLADRGVSTPRIVGEVLPYPINHGAAHGEWAVKDCHECHRADSRVTRPFTLASYVPGEVLPELVPGAATSLSGDMYVTDDGALVLQPVPAYEGLYVIGHDRVGWIGWAGAAAALTVMLGLTVHGGLRVFHSANQARREPELRRVYMYTAYERSWHWLQALVIALLILTGMFIHMPDLFGLVNYQAAVRVHNVLGFVLLANAALAVFYHLAGGGIRRYLPEPKGFFSQAIAQVVYYVRGIMRGEPHPFEKQPEKRLNPLQQVTYLVILNVLLPLQILTGVLMWGAQRWPDLAARAGGLWVLAPVHTLVTWLFVAFLVLHIYLTTTGHTPLSNIKAMIVGWDDVEAHGGDAPEENDDGTES